MTKTKITTKRKESDKNTSVGVLDNKSKVVTFIKDETAKLKKLKKIVGNKITYYETRDKGVVKQKSGEFLGLNK